MGSFLRLVIVNCDGKGQSCSRQECFSLLSYRCFFSDCMVLGTKIEAFVGVLACSAVPKARKRGRGVGGWQNFTFFPKFGILQLNF